MHTLNERMKLIKKIILGIAAAGLLFAIVLLALILSKFEDDDTMGIRPAYVIILGAKVRPDGISPSLKRRLDRAIPLLRADTGLIAIVSGGKGADEPVSEAKAMHDYLLVNGIRNSQIIQEDQSASTEENIRYSRVKIGGKQNESIAIWLSTSNYHQYRSQLIARDVGLVPYGIPCSTPTADLPRYIIREMTAVAARLVD